MGRMRPLRAALAVLACLVGVVSWSVPAAASTSGLAAHAQLVSTDPADGATLDTLEQVTLTFSEDVNQQFVQVTVEGPQGDETDGPVEVDRGTVTQPLAADLPAGEHTVVYRVVSVDGHPVSGTFSFTTTQGPSGSPSPSASTPATPSAEATSTSPPAVSTPSPSPSIEPTATSSEGTPGWLVPTLIGLVVLVLLAGGILLARPRRSPDDEPSE